MKLDWKNVLGAAFFAAALFGSGIASAEELSAAAANQNAVCACSRVQFNDPNCVAIKDQLFGPGAAGGGAGNHMAALAAPKAMTPPTAPTQQIK